jgi:hypothetical protein
MKPMANVCGIAAAFMFLSVSESMAETPPLPSPADIFTIAIKPQAKQLTAHFTPASLLAALPDFKPAYMLEPIGGKIWSQSGVIVLKDKTVLFWRSYRDDVIAVETGGKRFLYAIDR